MTTPITTTTTTSGKSARDVELEELRQRQLLSNTSTTTTSSNATAPPPSSMMDWQWKQRELKKKERAQVSATKQHLTKYRGHNTILKDSEHQSKAHSLKLQQRHQKMQAEQQLRGYRMQVDPNNASPKKNHTTNAAADQYEHVVAAAQGPGRWDPAKEIRTGAVSGTRDAFSSTTKSPKNDQPGRSPTYLSHNSSPLESPQPSQQQSLQHEPQSFHQQQPQQPPNDIATEKAVSPISSNEDIEEDSGIILIPQVEEDEIEQPISKEEQSLSNSGVLVDDVPVKGEEEDSKMNMDDDDDNIPKLLVEEEDKETTTHDDANDDSWVDVKRTTTTTTTDVTTPWKDDNNDGNDNNDDNDDEDNDIFKTTTTTMTETTTSVSPSVVVEKQSSNDTPVSQFQEPATTVPVKVESLESTPQTTTTTTTTTTSSSSSRNEPTPPKPPQLPPPTTNTNTNTITRGSSSTETSKPSKPLRLEIAFSFGLMSNHVDGPPNMFKYMQAVAEIVQSALSSTTTSNPQSSSSAGGEYHYNSRYPPFVRRIDKDESFESPSPPPRQVKVKSPPKSTTMYRPKSNVVRYMIHAVVPIFWKGGLSETTTSPQPTQPILEENNPVHEALRRAVKEGTFLRIAKRLETAQQRGSTTA